jgi:hypothetical protein
LKFLKPAMHPLINYSIRHLISWLCCVPTLVGSGAPASTSALTFPSVPKDVSHFSPPCEEKIPTNWPGSYSKRTYQQSYFLEKSTDSSCGSASPQHSLSGYLTQYVAIPFYIIHVKLYAGQLLPWLSPSSGFHSCHWKTSSMKSAGEFYC